MILDEAKIMAAIESATRAFEDLQSQNTSGTKKKKDADLTSIVRSLLSLVSDLFNCMKSISTNGSAGGQPDDVKNQIRKLEDEVDENKQRNLKGNFIITSQERNGKVCLIKTDQQLEEEGLHLEEHVVELVKEKMAIDLPLQDIESCHRLPNRGVILRLWNKKPNSAYSGILKAIKSGRNAEMNVYFNFQLTKRRNTLMYEIRSMKRDGKIHKFFTGENGAISIIIKEGDPKKKITYSEGRNHCDPTLNVDELIALVNQ